MRTPSAFLLSQTVTIYNKLSSDGKPVNGGYQEQYKRTVLNNVKYVQREGAVTTSSHGAVNDGLYLLVFSTVSNAEGYSRYVNPGEFANAKDHSRIWTFQKDSDYIALGDVKDSKPSFENKGTRNDYKITTVDIRYDRDGRIHHFEVNAK